MFIDGAFSHAARKQPALTGPGDGHDLVTPAEPDADELDLAARILERVGRRLLYARVDVARDDEGTARLMEAELAEPALFLAQAEGALDRFAGAVARRCP